MRSEIFVKIFVFISLFLIYNSLNLQKQKDFSFLQTQMKLQTFSKFIEDYNEISIEFNKEENLDSDTLYAYYDKKNSKIIITKDENKENENNLISKGKYQKTRFKTGWDLFESKTYNNANPIIQLYSIGIIEGILSQEEIKNYMNNFRYAIGGNERAIQLKQWFKEADENIKRKINNINNKSKYDLQSLSYLACLHAQINGLYKGYNLKSEDDDVDIYELYLLNSEGNYDNTLSYMAINNIEYNKNENFENDEILMKYYNTTKFEEIWKKLIKKSHCSAIVKLINKNGDKNILFGHNTWTGFYELLRTYKSVDYAFEGNNQIIGLKPIKMKYSSYPGILFSGDEYYTIENNLAITQTSLSTIFPQRLYHALNIKEYIPEFMRIMTINFLSRNGKEWVKNFKKLYNGNHIYFASWIIVDYNKINSKKDLIYIAEEVPENVMTVDYTKEFLKKGFYGSYNLPFFKEHNIQTGIKYFNIDLNDIKYNPRGYLVKNLINDVNDFTSFQDLLTYNKYKMDDSKVINDPSVNDPFNGIASRGYDYGTVDYKIIDKDLIKSGNIYAYSGPIYGKNPNFPPFNKNDITTDLKDYMEGIPEKFEFEPILINFE